MKIMKKENSLYQEFLSCQDSVEISRGEKLEQNDDSRLGFHINMNILNDTLDVLAVMGKIKDDKDTKNIYRNSYLFARYVAYKDTVLGSRGILKEQIMEDLFENASSSVKDTCLVDVNGIRVANLAPLALDNSSKIIECFGLSNGEWKFDDVVCSKYGSLVVNGLLDDFCKKYFASFYDKNKKSRGR